MLTNNARIILFPTTASSIQQKMCTGNASSVSKSNVFGLWNNATYGLNIEFGKGTTPATKEDYVVEESLQNSLTTSVISRSNPSTAPTFSDVPSLIFVTALVTNETGEDITDVTEVCIIHYTSSGATGKTLLTRTVLTEPLTFEAGKTYQITVAVN